MQARICALETEVGMLLQERGELQSHHTHLMAALANKNTIKAR